MWKNIIAGTIGAIVAGIILFFVFLPSDLAEELRQVDKRVSRLEGQFETFTSLQKDFGLLKQQVSTVQNDVKVTNDGISSFQKKTNAEIKELRKILAEPPHESPQPIVQDRRVIMHSNRGPIRFVVPTAFTCGNSLTWNDLEDWRYFEDKRICSDSNVYPVKGRILAEEGTTLSAEIFVPEIDKWFPASGGGITIPDDNGYFSVNFCMHSIGPSRTFRFRLIHHGQPVGDECRINIENM